MEEKQSIKEQFIDLLMGKSDDEIAQMADQAAVLMAYYRCAALEIETKFKVLNEQFSLSKERNPIESIKTRIKSFPSIREKLHRRSFPMNLDSMRDNLNDIAGVRVICSFVDDIYMLADCLLQQDDVKLIEKKDYITDPKANGYRSLHLIVEIPIYLYNEKRYMRVEVQIRTIAMDFWASLDHQLKYKKEFMDSDEISAELKECAEIIAETDARMLAIRQSIEMQGIDIKKDY